MMKRAAFTLATLAAFGTAALALPEQKTIKCAVMTGSTVTIKSAISKKMYADYKGRRYFFCCDGCPAAFRANPKKYAKNASLKTPIRKRHG